MALELTKKPAKEKAVKCPKKKGINLAKGEQKKALSKYIIIAAAAVIAVALVAKFGFIDQYAKLHEAQAEYDDLHVQYLASMKSVERKAEVEAEYRHYTIDWMKEGAVGYVSIQRVDILDLVESELMGCGHINSIVVQGSVATVRMTNMSLKDISEMFESLVDHPLVESVSLDTASTSGEKTNEGNAQTQRDNADAEQGDTVTETAENDGAAVSGNEDPGDSLVFVITINLKKA